MRSDVLTKFGIEVDSIEECSWTVADALKWVTGTSLKGKLVPLARLNIWRVTQHLGILAVLR